MRNKIDEISLRGAAKAGSTFALYDLSAYYSSIGKMDDAIFCLVEAALGGYKLALAELEKYRDPSTSICADDIIRRSKLRFNAVNLFDKELAKQNSKAAASAPETEKEAGKESKAVPAQLSDATAQKKSSYPHVSTPREVAKAEPRAKSDTYSSLYARMNWQDPSKKPDEYTSWKESSANQTKTARPYKA